MATAIREMHVRGAGLIGAAAGYGMYLAARARPWTLAEAAAQLKATRPTAVNLAWAIERQLQSNWRGRNRQGEDRDRVSHTAQQIAEEDAEHCRRIGQHGLELIRQIAQT